MKLLLDEHFSPEIARQLRKRGHDVVATREREDLRGLSDEELLGMASEERRALVTENVADFVALHRRTIIRRQSHGGIVFTSARRFPRNSRTIGRLVRALDDLLRDRLETDALESQSWWL